MKLTKEQREDIRKLRAEGLTQQAIAKQFGVSQNCIRYHTLTEAKANAIVYQTKRYINFPIEKKKELYLKKKPYLKEYFKRRYHNDEEFRRKQIERVKKINLQEKGIQLSSQTISNVI